MDQLKSTEKHDSGINEDLLKLTEQQKKDLKGWRYGCMNCLWASSECINMSKFFFGGFETDRRIKKTVAICKCYSYYD